MRPTPSYCDEVVFEPAYRIPLVRLWYRLGNPGYAVFGSHDLTATRSNDAELSPRPSNRSPPPSIYRRNLGSPCYAVWASHDLVRPSKGNSTELRPRPTYR